MIKSRAKTFSIVAAAALGIAFTLDGVGIANAQSMSSQPNDFRGNGSANVAIQREKLRLEADSLQLIQQTLTNIQSSEAVGNLNIITNNRDSDIRIDQQNLGSQTSLVGNDSTLQNNGPQSSIPGAQ